MIRRLVQALRREGEYLDAGFRDADAVLELCRERAVARHRRPAVVQYFHAEAAEIDHGLDGEEHSGFQAQPVAGLAVMNDVGQGMENPTDAVTAEIPHYRATLLAFGVGLDRVTDIAGGSSRLHGSDAAHHRFVSDFNQAHGFAFHVADQIHAARIAMPAVDDHRHGFGGAPQRRKHAAEM